MKPLSFILLVLLIALFGWYLIADRLTPITSQARVRAYVVPIVPQASGYVADVSVEDNSLVEAGQEMMTTDQRPYKLALETAQANLDLAGQSVGANTAQGHLDLRLGSRCRGKTATRYTPRIAITLVSRSANSRPRPGIGYWLVSSINA